MKKRIVLFLIQALFYFKIAAQIFNCTISSPTTCISQTATLSVTVPQFGATFYGWSVSPLEQINPLASTSGSQAVITFTSCGTHTVTCNAYNGSTFAGAVTFSTTVLCSTISVTPSTQTVCNGASVTLTASGANSYTWSTSQNAPVISFTPVVPPFSQGMPNPYPFFYSVVNDSSCVAFATVYVMTVSVTTNRSSLCAGFTGTLTASGATNFAWTGPGLPLAPPQPSVVVGPGTYTASTPSGSGVCMDSITIVLNPPLVISVSQSSYTTCITNNVPQFSKPVSLFVAGATNYTWSPGFNSYSISVRPVTSTCYTVVGGTSICSGSAVTCVSVTPQYTINVSASASVACISDMVVLTVTNVSTLAAGSAYTHNYSWAFQPMSASVSSLVSPTVIVYPANTTFYSVEMLDAQQCVSLPFQGTITVSICTGLEEEILNSAHERFSFYPNPTLNRLTIRANAEESQELLVTITDITGRLMQQVAFNCNAEQKLGELDLSALGPGIYNLTIYSGQQILQRTKCVKE